VRVVDCSLRGTRGDDEQSGGGERADGGSAAHAPYFRLARRRRQDARVPRLAGMERRRGLAGAPMPSSPSLRSGALVLLVLAAARSALGTTPAQDAPKPAAPAVAATPAANFTISFPAARSAEPLDGRLVLILATDGASEPREQLAENTRCGQVFGIDVDGWRSDAAQTFDGRADGFPFATLNAVPAGDYFVQALLNRYETFHRADGHVVKLAPDRGEGQQWNKKPGNLYSKPLKVHFDPKGAATGAPASPALALSLDQEIAPIEPAKDTAWIKHIKIKSERLSKF